MENEFKVNLYEIMKTANPSGRHSEDGAPAGDTVRSLILDNWDTHEKVSIYFEGIVGMTRPFADEAFGKLLETRSLEEFNAKLFFPDANDRIVKELNGAMKIRMKIIQSQKDREDNLA